MQKIIGTDQAWDNRELGASLEHAKQADAQDQNALDAALGLAPISIRLPREMVDAYKLIASHHGIGYQPLMRDVLQRYIKEGLKEVMERQGEKSEQAHARIEQMHQTA